MTTPNTDQLVIVTGSSGLIGGRICERLKQQYTVVGLDIQKPESPVANVEYLDCDLTDDKSVDAALATVRNSHGRHVASVVHLAAYYDFAGEDSPLYHDLTVEGTRRMLRGLHAFDRVEQFVFSSSLLVMKPCEPGEKLTETSPARAEWQYPESKLAAEDVIRREAGAIPAVILRLAGVYDEYGHSLPITQNIRRIAEKEMESYFYPGDAERGQAFVHLDDLVDCFERTVQHRGDLDPFETFLIAEDECLSYESLQDLIGEELHGVDDWPTIRIPKVVAKAGAWVKDKAAASEQDRPFIKPWMVDMADAHYPVDNSKAQKRLAWVPKHRLSETLPKMLWHLKKNPRQWYELNHLPLPNKETLKELEQMSLKSEKQHA
ncbi:NAD(P)-dependent oxidoreductase [Aeoliella sp. ICT_H6.2]|uniref:NAD(P)-dependent oxidoreductase n=1 Tax=Aeoliella straminimaris TaxID=2954799 RepID=A0A9X2FE77_9BACT|nr:NAD(P)-dependent oxidoreductase [Aeoliella straminimaris]MCO6047492.1 NAD(P)-dependent oxidoreductase [Aeoliella straminimaris]